MTSLRQQLRDNAVALISLVVALGSLAYNTWRNERTEHNRNVRTAAFELLTRVAELERVVFLAQYDRDAAGGNPRTGWTYVLVIRDLSAVVPPPVPAQAAELQRDRKSTRLNSSHGYISYAVFCLKKKKKYNSEDNYTIYFLHYKFYIIHILTYSF